MSDITFRWTIRKSGVLTDADATPTLSDSTSAFGIRRVDTGAIIVANGTTMTRDSVGVYSYTFTGTAGITYEGWIKGITQGSPFNRQKFVTGGTTGTGMTLTDARQLVRDNTRNGGDSSAYSDYLIDRAIQTLCTLVTHDFAVPKIVGTVSLVKDTATVDISALVDNGFEPHHMLAAYITTAVPDHDPTLFVITNQQRVKMYNEESSAAVPQYLTFKDSTTCLCYPVPDANYTAEIQWFQQFQRWTPGADGASVTINVQEEILYPILTLGVPMFIQKGEPEHDRQTLRLQPWYLQLKESVKGIGSMSPSIVVRDGVRTSSGFNLKLGAG